MDDDPATTYDRLRIETAAMLGFDYAALTAAQSVRVDRAAILRLELDDCQTKKLEGQPFDTNKYVATSEALERLLGSDPETSTAHDFSGAREELRRFFAQRADAIARRDAREAEAAIAAASWKTACSDAPGDDGVAHPPPSLAAPAGGGEPPPLIEPPPVPPPPPRRIETDEEKMARVNAVPVPQHYLKGPPEPWRPYVSEDGSISTSPWSRGRY
jgi:hypothetical protein